MMQSTFPSNMAKTDYHNTMNELYYDFRKNLLRWRHEVLINGFELGPIE